MATAPPFEMHKDEPLTIPPSSSDAKLEHSIEPDEQSPVEQVRLTVPTHDDPSLPVWTFRMWFLGMLSCGILSFLNTFFGYRSEPLTVTTITAQVATLPIGRFMAKVLPEKRFRVPGFGDREFSLNPGPFNIKEHALISVFASSGFAFGYGTAYAVGVVDIVKALYHRKISFLASWILVISTQVIGYGFAGLLRKYVVEPAEMWWPSSLVQVSLLGALHEKETSRMSRAKFFVIALICSFSLYTFPGYLLKISSTISILCLLYPQSITHQQIGSGLKGLGIASFTVDWTVVVAFLGSPLITPFFAIVNFFVGYVAVAYVVVPVCYWGFDLYDGKSFPFFSLRLFDVHGKLYNVSAIVDGNFELDVASYGEIGPLRMSLFLAITYGLSFAGVVTTITHVAFFNGREIWTKYKASSKGKLDIHTQLMRRYEEIPGWWFHGTLVLSLALSLLLCIFMNDQVQLPWWALLLSVALSPFFTLPISIITATTNTTPGLNVITEYVFGLLYTSRPVANVCFKTYGYMSMSQAISFLNDFKFGHYMKIPPKSMFLVQFIGTIMAGTINIAVAWYLLTSIPNICNPSLLPEDSPWTCPHDNMFYTASVIWGLVGPKQVFGSGAFYSALNWCFIGGALAPILVYMAHKMFPKQEWIKLINFPVLLGATAYMPPGSTINFNSWIVVGTIFNLFVFRYRKRWWKKYNYVFSAAMDAGTAFMGVLLYFCLDFGNIKVQWWGAKDHCDLALCPTAKGVAISRCPVVQ